jgi:hypothetical protein
MSAPIPDPTPRRRRVRVIQLQAEILPDGKVRISSPMARGWAGVGRAGTHEVGRVVSQAFDEVTAAAYARAHGQVYDLDALTMHVQDDQLAGTPQRRIRGPVARRAAHPPEAWAMLDDGRWRSPGGRKYRADSPQVRAVRRAREEKGLPTSIDPHTE